MASGIIKPRRWFYLLPLLIFLLGVADVSEYLRKKLGPASLEEEIMQFAGAGLIVWGIVGSTAAAFIFYRRRRANPSAQGQRFRSIVASAGIFMGLLVAYCLTGMFGTGLLIAILIPQGLQRAGAAVTCPPGVMTTVQGSHEDLYLKAKELIGQYEGDQGVLCQAQANLQEVLKAKPDYALAYVQLVQVETRLGYISNEDYNPANLQKGHEYVAQALSLAPKMPEAHVQKGYLYLYQRDYVNTRKTLEEAERIQPSVETTMLRVELAEREGNYDEAIAGAKAVLADATAQKKHEHALQVLTDGYKAKKDYQSAAQAYETLIQMQPNSPWDKINYAGFLVDYVKDYDKAIELAKASLSQMDFGVGHRTLSNAYYGKGAELFWKKGEKNKAGQYFQLAIKENPSHAHAHYGLGAYYDFIGSPNEAVREFRIALRINPNFQDAKEALKRH